jgi:hypothetical protein
MLTLMDSPHVWIAQVVKLRRLGQGVVQCAHRARFTMLQRVFFVWLVRTKVLRDSPCACPALRVNIVKQEQVLVDFAKTESLQTLRPLQSVFLVPLVGLLCLTRQLRELAHVLYVLLEHLPFRLE